MKHAFEDFPASPSDNLLNIYFYVFTLKVNHSTRVGVNHFAGKIVIKSPIRRSSELINYAVGPVTCQFPQRSPQICRLLLLVQSSELDPLNWFDSTLFCLATTRLGDRLFVNSRRDMFWFTSWPVDGQNWESVRLNNTLKLCGSSARLCCHLLFHPTSINKPLRS